MAINKIFREMFNEQKRKNELGQQKEIIRRALEDQGNMVNDYDRAMDLLEIEAYEDAIPLLIKCAEKNNASAQYELGRLLKEGIGTEINKEISKEYLMKSYKNGYKKSGALLREMRHEENENFDKIVDTEYETIISDLGYKIDMPKNWVKLESKNKHCFDTIAIDVVDGDVIFNIKMQVFLIEIPKNMSFCVDLDRVANNMGCIESVSFNNGNCNGKLICGEGLDGTCNYLFISKGMRGVYDVRVIVDKYLDPIYEEVIDHIIYSFDILDKIPEK